MWFLQAIDVARIGLIGAGSKDLVEIERLNSRSSAEGAIWENECNHWHLVAGAAARETHVNLDWIVGERGIL